MLSLLQELVILFPAFVLVFTARGFFKTLTANLMGDDTAKRSGFLTFNPLVHIDLFGLLIVLFVLFFLGGIFFGALPRAFLFILLILAGARWAIPVPIEEQNFRNYKLGVILTTLAGSVGNFFVALIFLYILSYFPFALFPQYVFISLIEIFNAIIDMSIFFGVLNLIPIPPFDGGRLLQFILPVFLHNVISWLEEYSLYILLALFFLPGVSNIFFKFLYILSMLIKQFLLFLVF